MTEGFTGSANPNQELATMMQQAMVDLDTRMREAKRIPAPGATPRWEMDASNNSMRLVIDTIPDRWSEDG